MYTKKLRRVCCSEVIFNLEDGIVRDVSFDVPENKGCKPGLTCFSLLVEGKNAQEIIDKISSIECRGTGTSCYKQFAKELKRQLLIQEKVGE